MFTYRKDGCSDSAVAFENSIQYFRIRLFLRGTANVSGAGSLSFFHVELGGARDRYSFGAGHGVPESIMKALGERLN